MEFHCVTLTAMISHTWPKGHVNRTNASRKFELIASTQNATLTPFIRVLLLVSASMAEVARCRRRQAASSVCTMHCATLYGFEFMDLLLFSNGIFHLSNKEIWCESQFLLIASSFVSRLCVFCCKSVVAQLFNVRATSSGFSTSIRATEKRRRSQQMKAMEEKKRNRTKREHRTAMQTSIQLAQYAAAQDVDLSAFLLLSMDPLSSSLSLRLFVIVSIQYVNSMGRILSRYHLNWFLLRCVAIVRRRRGWQMNCF